MKKIHYILILFCACMVNISCTSENDPEPSINGTNQISFNIHIPDARTITTREAIAAGMIENMYVLIFDENGHFMSKTLATVGSNPGNFNVSLAPTDPDLETAKKKRFVHFVCNYDWSNFSDVQNLGKSEQQIIMSLSVTGKKIAYWQRVVCTEGIHKDVFPDAIILLRNVAKISLMDNPTVNPEPELHLTDMSFAIDNSLSYGTVAPYNNTLYTFDENSIIESPDATLQHIEESNFVQAGYNNTIGESIICYEKKNSTATKPLYVILKGKYQSNQYTYYKLDIFDEDEEILYDIQRNVHYIISIKKVMAPGSATLQEAIDSPASNNLLYSVLLEKYTSISDGKSILNIETTEKTLVQANKEYSFSYSYIPDITTGIENNTNVTVAIKQEEKKEILDESSIVIGRSVGKASVKVKTVSTLPDYDIYAGKLIFYATTNGVKLRRAINLSYRKPYELEKVSAPSNVATGIGNKVDIQFTIPATIKSTLFPMEVFITTTMLAPNVDAGFDNKLTLDYEKPMFRYKYIADKPGNHTLHFKTSSTTVNEDVILESELFAPKTITIKN